MPRILRPFPAFEEWSASRLGPERWLRFEYGLALAGHLLWNSMTVRAVALAGAAAVLLRPGEEAIPLPAPPPAEAAPAIPAAAPDSAPAPPPVRVAVAEAWAVMRATRGAAGELGQHEAWNLLQASTDVTGADLSRASLRRGCFTAPLDGLAAQEADLTGAVFLGARVTDGRFARARLPEAAVLGGVWDGVDLTAADLRGARLVRTALTGATLRGATAPGLTIEGGSLRDAVLDGADLTGAVLSAGPVSDAADPAAAKRTAAARRCGIGFAETAARLHGDAGASAGIDAAGTSWKGARLTRADLRGLRGLTQAALREACSDGGLKLPPGLRPPKACAPVRPRPAASVQAPRPAAKPAPVRVMRAAAEWDPSPPRKARFGRKR